MLRNATCCCGKVSVEVKGEPVLHALCHCKNCKKRTGSAFGISAYFPNASIIMKTGETQLYAVENREYRHTQKRHFCPECGTTVFWMISTMPDLTGIAGGCFAENPLPEPTHTLSNDGMCSWVQLPEHWKKSLSGQG